MTAVLLPCLRNVAFNPIRHTLELGGLKVVELSVDASAGEELIGSAGFSEVTVVEHMD